MARQILGSQQQQRQQSRTSSEFRSMKLERETRQADPAAVRQALRKKRSPEYLETLRKLDLGGNLGTTQATQELIDAVEREFDMVSLRIPAMLESIVAKCYLGEPYEVHTLDMTGGIIEHFETYRKMPGKAEQVRNLAKNPAYDFIEVYTDYACAVDKFGNVSMVEL